MERDAHFSTTDGAQLDEGARWGFAQPTLWLGKNEERRDPTLQGATSRAEPRSADSHLHERYLGLPRGCRRKAAGR